MPVITVKMTKEHGGATTEQKRVLIRKITSAFVEVMGRGEKTTVVIIEEVDMENYGIGGEQVSEIRKRQT
ncbi:MAG: 4-oxalocrotonate tautomerase family protein [Calditerrivibrio sp.]|nr:4-oxalocrotonate tautomerase family protein [Calditerrivibrio sp.]